jgi:transcriptional regulator with XRE-family HTH domain
VSVAATVEIPVGVEFGRRLRAARVARGIPGREFARRTGMSGPNLVRLEDGLGGPELATLFRLARPLGVPVEWLAGIGPDEVPSEAAADVARVCEAFGGRVRFAREARGMTQAEVAREMGVSFSQVSKIECGARSNPRLSTVRRFATVLAVPVAWLLLESDDLSWLEDVPWDS